MMHHRALLLGRYQQEKEKLNEELAVFQQCIQPFETWEPMGKDQCDALVKSIQRMQAVVRDIRVSHQAYGETLDMDEQVMAMLNSPSFLNRYMDEACVRVVAYSQKCSLLSERILRKRLEVRQYLQSLAQDVQAVLNYRLPHSDEVAHFMQAATVVEADEAPNDETSNIMRLP